MLEEKDQEMNKEKEEFGEDDIELVTDEPEGAGSREKPAGAEIQELNNKYLRLYADFENYRKRANKDKEDLI